MPPNRTSVTDPEGYTPTFGVEEEFLLLDARTGEPLQRAGSITAQAHPSITVEREFLSSQIETATPVCHTGDEAISSLQLSRQEFLDKATHQDFVVAGTGLPPVRGETIGTVTAEPRYRVMAGQLRQLAKDLYVTGTHVHVAIPSPDVGVDALNRLQRWMPLLLAISANSPLWCGEDTGFASWRYTKLLTWPIAGYPPEFRTAEEYFDTVQTYVDSGLILDVGAVTWVARLSQRFPTLEVRVADAQLTAEDAVCFALLVRALVVTGISEHEAQQAASGTVPQLTNGAMWLAARDGLTQQIMNPVTGEAVAAHTALAQLHEYTRNTLDSLGDLERVEAYLHRLQRWGSPAKRQRDRFAEQGLSGLLNLYRDPH